MKGGNLHRSKGKHFVVTLLAVICMTILLLYYERKPLVTTLLTPQDQFHLPTSDVLQVASHVSEDLVKSKDHSIPEPLVVRDEIDDKTKPQLVNVENTEPVAEKSSITKEDEQSSPVHEETGDKTKPHYNIENTESVSFKSSASEEDERSSKVHKEREDKTKPQNNFENAELVSFKSSASQEDERSSQVHEEKEDKTKPQNNFENAELVSFKSSASQEDERSSQVHEEREDKTKPRIANARNTEPMAEQSSVSEKDERDAASSTEKKVCNYAKGRWIVNRKRPLYSGSKCKQWLSEMWACRLTQRPDFSYESYRWQPENCDVPEFERSAFLKRMQDKTIAFVGDSLGRQQFQSLMCMVTGGEESPEVQNVGRKYGLVTRHGSARPDGWAFRFPETNTTILFYWSSCLCDLEPLNLSDRVSDVAMHLDQPPSFLKRFLHHFDVLILNTGHHWNRGKVKANRWVMHVDGKPNQDKRLAPIGSAKNFTIFSVAKWLDSQLPSHPQLKAFFRTISPRHFFNGEWNTGGSCENTTPLARGYEVKQDESSDQVIASAVRGTKIHLLDITALSQLRDEGHISRYSIKGSSGIQDCLHWCLPGIPDTWNEILAAQL